MIFRWILKVSKKWGAFVCKKKGSNSRHSMESCAEVCFLSRPRAICWSSVFHHFRITYCRKHPWLCVSFWHTFNAQILTKLLPVDVYPFKYGPCHSKNRLLGIGNPLPENPFLKACTWKSWGKYLSATFLLLLCKFDSGTDMKSSQKILFFTAFEQNSRIFRYLATVHHIRQKGG